MSIKKRLLVWYFVIISAILTIFSLGIFLLVHWNIKASLDKELKVIIQHTKIDFKKNNKNELEEEVMDFPLRPLYIRIVKYDIKSQKFTVIQKTKKFDFDVITPEITLSPQKEFYYFNYQTHRFISTVAYRDRSEIWSIEVGTTSAKDSSIEKILFISLMIINPLILLISLIGGYFLVNRIFVPIKKLSKDINKVTVSKLSERLPDRSGSEEIDEIIDSFNSLLDRLEISFTKVSQFGSNASHELKTPLTVMRGEMEIALRRDRELGDYKGTLVSSLEEIGRIQKIVDELLFLSKSDNNQIQDSFEGEYIDEVVLESIEDLKTYISNKGAQLTFGDFQPCELPINKNLLKTAIKNIVKNAIDYGGEKPEVKISLIDGNIIIEDNGIGIAEEDIKKIFDRFYRVDKARTRISGGSGLGMSIVKAIMDIHNGEILVESSLGVGTKITLVLNRAKSENI